MISTGSQIGILLAIAILVILNKKVPTWRSKLMGVLGSATPEEKKNMILVGLTLVVLNLLLWGMVPWLWRVLIYKWYALILFNIGLGAFLYLSKADPKKLAVLVGGALVLGLLTNTYFEYNLKSKIEAVSNEVTSPQTIRSAVLKYPYKGRFGPHNVPAEQAVRRICSCESTGSPDNTPVHYEKDGITLLKNKEGSSARGECQLMPPHWEYAKKLGLDLDKVEDYRTYVLNLYNRTWGKHWEVNEEKGGGSACWGEALAKIAEEQDNYTVEFRAPKGFGPETETRIPPWYGMEWGNSDDPFQARNQNGHTVVYDRPNGVFGQYLPNNSRVVYFSSTQDTGSLIRLEFDKRGPTMVTKTE